MGIFSNIFGNRKEEKLYNMMIANQMPIFSSFGNDIYLSDFVNNAIDRIASEISKVDVKSVVQRNNMVLVQNDDITRLFANRPNPLQTSGDFLRNVEWQRRKIGNAFVYPQYVQIPTKNGLVKKYTALYPLAPTDFRFGTDEEAKEWYVQFWFSDGTQWTFPYADLLHFKWRRGNNTIIGGGDDSGGINDRDTLRTVQALDKTIQGIPKTIEAALNMNGVLTVKSAIAGDKLDKEREDFENHIIKSKNGILATTLAGDFTPINKSAATIPDNLLKFLKSVIQEKYGVSEAILSGDYNGDQNAAFYQTAIEDFLVEFEQEMASKLFTPREMDVGHKVKGYYSKINYLSTKDKMELATIATNTGLMMLNEIAEMYGMAPFEGGNRRIMSLNYISADIADQYQLGGEKMKSKLITRAFNFDSEVKDDSNIEGMAAVFNQTVSIGGWFDEVIEPGAFDECDFRDVLFFINHDTNKITLARSRRNNPNSTMQIEAVADGLHIKANVDAENNYEAKALISAVKRGDMAGMSLMFRVDEEKWENLDSETPLRRIQKIKKVYEVSAVNFPAYDETSLSARDSALDNADLNALERAKADYDSKLDSFKLTKRKFIFKESMR